MPARPQPDDKMYLEVFTQPGRPAQRRGLASLWSRDWRPPSALRIPRWRAHTPTMIVRWRMRCAHPP